MESDEKTLGGDLYNVELTELLSHETPTLDIPEYMANSSEIDPALIESTKLLYTSMTATPELPPAMLNDELNFVLVRAVYDVLGRVVAYLITNGYKNTAIRIFAVLSTNVTPRRSIQVTCRVYRME